MCACWESSEIPGELRASEEPREACRARLPGLSGSPISTSSSCTDGARSGGGPPRRGMLGIEGLWEIGSGRGPDGQTERHRNDWWYTRGEADKHRQIEYWNHAREE